MLGTIVSPMDRGQITLPKSIRDALDITPDTLLNIVLDGRRILVQPLSDLLVNSKPKIDKAEYLRLLKNMSGIAWTKGDDKYLKNLRQKDRLWEV